MDNSNHVYNNNNNKMRAGSCSALLSMSFEEMTTGALGYLEAPSPEEARQNKWIISTVYGT